MKIKSLKFCRKKQLFSYVLMNHLWLIYGASVKYPWGGILVTRPKITIKMKEPDI